jgi:hypothetical protein
VGRSRFGLKICRRIVHHNHCIVQVAVNPIILPDKNKPHFELRAAWVNANTSPVAKIFVF